LRTSWRGEEVLKEGFDCGTGGVDKKGHDAREGNYDVSFGKGSIEKKKKRSKPPISPNQEK